MNGFTPRPGAAGQRPSRGQVAGLTQAMVSQRIIESPDIVPVAGAGGTALRFRRPLPAAQAAPALPPLHVISRTTVAAGWRIGMTAGRVYSANYDSAPLVPTLDGVALDAATPPTKTVAFAVAHVYLHVVTGATELVVPPITVELVDAGAAQPANDFLNGYLHVATVTKGGNEAAPTLGVEILLSGHRAHRKVNLTHLWGRM